MQAFPVRYCNSLVIGFSIMTNIVKLCGFRHPKGLCYVDERFKLIFVPIPKNASTSVRNMSGLQFYTDNIMAYTQKIAQREYKAFAIIREPVQRFISGYIEVCKRATGDSTQTLKKDFYWLTGRQRFEKFIEEIEADCFDAHMYPQNYFLCNYSDKPFLLDAYIDIQQLATGLPFVMDRLLGEGGNITVPKLNVSGKGRRVSLSNKVTRKIHVSNIQRSFYYTMDSVVRRLQRRRIPTVAEVNVLLSENESLLARIKSFLAEDIRFFNKIRRENPSVSQSPGVHWLRN